MKEGPEDDIITAQEPVTEKPRRKVPVIPHVTRDLHHLPDSATELAIADYLTKEMFKEIKESKRCRAIRVMTLDAIDDILGYAAEDFKKQIKKYKPKEKDRFIDTRKSANENFKQLQMKHIKLFWEETKNNN